MLCFFFFFNDTATTEIYTLSLHDALPISATGTSTRSHPPISKRPSRWLDRSPITSSSRVPSHGLVIGDRKSTRLNSSHGYISYAVFCLKKKKKRRQPHST